MYMFNEIKNICQLINYKKLLILNKKLIFNRLTGSDLQRSLPVLLIFTFATV
jgi:hypothetical protein